MIENSTLFAVDAPFNGKVEIVEFQRISGHYCVGEAPSWNSRPYLCLMRALESSERFAAGRIYQFYVEGGSVIKSNTGDHVSARYFHLVVKNKEDYLISVHDQLPNRTVSMAGVYERFFDEGPSFWATRVQAATHLKI